MHDDSNDDENFSNNMPNTPILNFSCNQVEKDEVEIDLNELLVNIHVK